MSRQYCQQCRGKGYMRGPKGMIRCGLCNRLPTARERAESRAAADRAYAPKPGEPGYDRYLAAQKLFEDIA